MSENQLLFKEARLLALHKFVGEDQTSQVLNIRALLTRPLAEKLKCRDLFFAENDMPRKFDRVKLDEVIENCGVTLPNGTFLARKITGFFVGHPEEATATDPSLEIKAAIHFPQNPHISEMFDNQNKAPFELILNPPKEWRAQGELPLQEPNPETSEPELDTGCIACNNRIGFSDPEQAVHETGAMCTRNESGPALAPARAMGGTHQKKRGRDRKTESAGEPEPVVQ